MGPLEDSHVGETISLREKGIDRNPLQKAEALFVPFRHDVFVGQWAATNQVIGQHRGASAAAADDSAAVQDCAKFTFGGCVFENVDQPPLPATGKPHAAGLAQLVHE